MGKYHYPIEYRGMTIERVRLEAEDRPPDGVTHGYRFIRHGRGRKPDQCAIYDHDGVMRGDRRKQTLAKVQFAFMVAGWK